ncbi:MAG: hypothetical protein ABIZ05_12715 [Pseudonocardiaceae bacterium]
MTRALGVASDLSCQAPRPGSPAFAFRPLARATHRDRLPGRGYVVGGVLVDLAGVGVGLEVDSTGFRG